MAQSKEIEINLKKYSYQNREPVLENIVARFLPGQINTFIGPSGCGKSTFLRILMGMETGAQGDLKIEGKEFSFLDWNAKQNVFSMVPQIPHLFPWKTVLDNIKIAITKDRTHEEKKTVLEIAQNALQTVGLLESAHKYPHEISLGMSQRVAFARALVQHSQALLLDEPFASLDAYTRKGLQQWLLEKIVDTKKYAVLVTHDIREAIVLSQNIYVLKGQPSHIEACFSKCLPQEGNCFRDGFGKKIETDLLEDHIYGICSGS